MQFCTQYFIDKAIKTQPAFASTDVAIDAPEQGVEYVQR